MCINNRKNGSTNGFTDFQNFANWCQTEYGYNNVDTHGKFWSIEKDMILLGNKVYKEDACMFVPAEVNSILNTHQGGSDLPLGVHHEHETEIRKWKYIGSCKGAQPVAARFNCQYEAHMWWLRQKISICEKFIDKHTDHKKLCGALTNIRDVYLYYLANHKILPADVNAWAEMLKPT